jgi:alpha-glucosidase
MRYIIGNFGSVEKTDNAGGGCTLRCRGENGLLTLTVFSAGIMLVDYAVEGAQNHPVCEEAGRLLRGSPRAAADLSVELAETGGACRITARDSPDEETTVFLDKRNGNLRFEYSGTVVLGGDIGNADTVLPPGQFRCVAGGDALPRYRFNFPMSDGDAFYGLGDKSGPPDRRNRRFKMFNRDALGYDAEFSDPLYKSIPFFIKHNSIKKNCVGLYFPESLIEYFDFGVESKFYFNTEILGGPASYYVFLGKNYRDLLRHYCEVTGFPALPPLFSFGFFGSSMNYAEDDRAAARIPRYFDDVEAHDIPCEGMYVSSGYLKADNGSRYAFFWNRRKFPDPPGFLKGLAGRGYNLCMNIKPGILTTHPWYGELRDKGYFITDRQGKAYTEFYWGGEASFLDFSKSGARQWWKEKLKENYIDCGCAGIWNDNNEMELEDAELDAYKDRNLFSVKMSQAAYEAFKECHGDLRPWIYSRSGYAGIQRYARTWSGDNVSDWKTLKFNQYQSLGLGLSALPFYGHDLGGFFGPPPEKELLVRSCQTAVFQPRFVIHSWREDGEPTEPWTYPGALEPIRHFIREHYRFMPYIYDAAREAAESGLPLDRPLFLEFPGDPLCKNSQVHSLFGPSVLKILAVERGENSVEAHLPGGADWYDPVEELLSGGGCDITLTIPLEEYRWFAKAGSVIPSSPGLRSLRSGLFPRVVFLVFPPAGAETVEYRHFEDDGRHELSLARYSEWKLRIVPSERGGTVTVEKTADGLAEPETGRPFCLELPAGFVFSGGGSSVEFNTRAYPLNKPFSVSYAGSYRKR